MFQSVILEVRFDQLAHLGRAWRGLEDRLWRQSPLKLKVEATPDLQPERVGRAEIPAVIQDQVGRSALPCPRKVQRDDWDEATWAAMPASGVLGPATLPTG